MNIIHRRLNTSTTIFTVFRNIMNNSFTLIKKKCPTNMASLNLKTFYLSPVFTYRKQTLLANDKRLWYELWTRFLDIKTCRQICSY